MGNFEFTTEISPEDYMDLRKAVGWGTFPLLQAKEGLDHTYYIACYKMEGKPVALARLLWDHGYVAYIADVIVVPRCQEHGLGRLLVMDILQKLQKELKPGYKIMVCLMSAKGKEEFYKKFGFESRPDEGCGAGMHQWLIG